eukprot:PITA_05465
MGSRRFCRGLNAASPTTVKSMSAGANLGCSNMIEEINPYMGEDCSTMVRKVMVVVDSTREAKRALLWVLSHALLKHDRLILLHVAPLPPGSPKKGIESPFSSKRHLNPKDSNFLNSLKSLCIQRRPEVNSCSETVLIIICFPQLDEYHNICVTSKVLLRAEFCKQVEVEVMIVEGFKDKGPTILQQAKKHSVSLLVLGQPKPPLLCKLRAIWSEKRWTIRSQDSSSAAAVEYCIQNSECLSVAVRTKSRRMGGYLISTKRQKNFWLLA